MKIIQVGGTFVGAQEKIEYAIHKRLLKEGHDSYILYAIGHSDEANIIKYENRFENFFRRFLRKYISKSPRSAFLSTNKLIYYIRKIKPDLVNLHVLHHGYIDYIRLFKFLSRKKIPVVYTAHDLWLNTGGCYYYSNVNCSNYLNGCINCPLDDDNLDCKKIETSKHFQRKKELVKGFNKFSTVCVSDWLCKEILDSHLSQYPVFTIPNAIDDTDYKMKSAPKNERFTVIAVASYWDERKGLSRFIELAQSVKEFADIFMVGCVPENTDLPDNIKLFGSISDKQKLYELYSVCDLHVSLSYEETFGLTFIEAALCGIKSVGLNLTAIPWVINKTYGYVAESSTVDEVAGILKCLSVNREECRLSLKQKESVLNCFSTKKMTSAYLDVYESLLK